MVCLITSRQFWLAVSYSLKKKNAQIEGLKVKVLPEKWSNPVRLSQTHPSDDPATCTRQNSTIAMGYCNSLSRALYEYNCTYQEHTLTSGSLNPRFCPDPSQIPARFQPGPSQILGYLAIYISLSLQVWVCDSGDHH